MGQREEWSAENLPLDEGYWESLLQDGENGRAAPAAAQILGWVSEPSPGDMEPLPQADLAGEWEKASLAMEQGKIIELPVIGCNRGGVLVEWEGLHGFVPASHLIELSPRASEEERRAEMEQLVGTRLRLKVIELNPEQHRFILSERALHSDNSRRQELLDTLSPGDIRTGSVTSLCSFGAFVDLGGLEGLIHVSELAWKRVEHPSDLLEPGQTVEVYVLDVDRECGRVKLSVKRLQPDPWQNIAEQYQVGQIVEGTITRVVDFGAFVRVTDGVEGLIHISELAEENFIHPRNVVQEGDTVTIRVLGINAEQRRMKLSLRQARQ